MISHYPSSTSAGLSERRQTGAHASFLNKRERRSGGGGEGNDNTHATYRSAKELEAAEKAGLVTTKGWNLRKLAAIMGTEDVWLWWLPSFRPPLPDSNNEIELKYL